MKDRTDIICILDRSGSMAGLEKDTIGGYNQFIAEQKKQEGKARLTTILFDHEYIILHNSLKLKKVQPLTEKDYTVRGGTALLDAIGKAIVMEDADPSGKVLVMIITDGYENSSKEFTLDKIKDMIQDREKKGWKFIFIGANMDAVAVAGKMGIVKGQVANYTANAVGTQSAYSAVSNVTDSYRGSGKIDKNWNSKIK